MEEELAKESMKLLIEAWDETKKKRKEIIKKDYFDELRDELINFEDGEFIKVVVTILDDYLDKKEK